MSDQSINTDHVLQRLDQHLLLRPALSERIHRELMMELHRRGLATIDRIHDEARTKIGRPTGTIIDDINQAERDRWDAAERQAVERITREYAAAHFSAVDVDDVVDVALKREEVSSLEKVANLPNQTFRNLADKIQRFCDLPFAESQLNPAEAEGTRVALVRHLVSDQHEFIHIAKDYLQVRDFGDLTRRMLGNDDGMGRIGGKAGGMLLAYHILKQAEDPNETNFPLAIPESYYLRSDVVEDFIRLNGLDEYQTQKYKQIDDLHREYPMLRGVFRNGRFPRKVEQHLRGILDKLGNHPLIVRSSSLLEDRFGTAFCGKYASYFLANQGTVEQRLQALLGTIGEVYASIFAPDPILYRREHNLIHYVEEMAVLIQKVVGVQVGDYFLPSFAGVAFSRNEYRWSPRIRREDGLVRIVMGLGTRAVDRGGPDYPRMVALGAPTLRPESSVKEIIRSAQQTVDAINLKENRFETIRVEELLAFGPDFPMLDRIMAILRDDELYPIPGVWVDAEVSELHVTFDKLLRSTPFAARIKGWLNLLEKAYGVPVDMEFACDGEKLYLLQCRMQAQKAEVGPVRVPKDIPEADILFDAHRYVPAGQADDIIHVVYVDPAAYDAITTREQRVQVARVIGRINHSLERRSFILIGPGRWGSNDIRLGVPVRYADINHCRVLIEVARVKDGFLPEVSFGTHFFQDLVEARIDYLPLYPDDPGNRFNESFFMTSPNVLAQLLPNDADFADIIRVIHIPTASKGRTLTIAMDPDSDHALAYLR
ncbi:MAG: PEP/pyruvate-binding domain-containing protein [Planctomycetota bacterium]